MSDHTAADLGDLERAGKDFDQIAGDLTQIKGALNSAVQMYGQVGSGEMGEALKKNYQPGEEVALQFLDLFHDLFIEKGNRLLKTARVFNDTNDDATGLASRPDADPDKG